LTASGGLETDGNSADIERGAVAGSFCAGDCGNGSEIWRFSSILGGDEPEGACVSGDGGVGGDLGFGIAMGDFFAVEKK
jgi:hypothetical protein